MKLRISLILIAISSLMVIVFLLLGNDVKRDVALKSQDSSGTEKQPAAIVPVDVALQKQDSKGTDKQPAANVPVKEKIQFDVYPKHAPEIEKQTPTPLVEKNDVESLGKMFQKMLTPPSATKEDWNALKVTKGAKTNDKLLYWSVINLRKVLEADTNTTSFHIGATNARLENGEIVTTIAGNKLSRTLSIIWNRGSFDHSDRAEATNSFSETHADQGQINNSKLGFGYKNGDENFPGISLVTFTDDGREERSFIRFEHGEYLQTPGFLSNNYPIGALPFVRGDTRRLKSILILDKVNSKIIENVVLPAGAKSGQPTFILDKKNDVLLVMQFGLDWIVAIDLKEYVKNIQKK